jgi:hypothetical protein
MKAQKGASSKSAVINQRRAWANTRARHALAKVTIVQYGTLKATHLQ